MSWRPYVSYAFFQTDESHALNAILAKLTQMHQLQAQDVADQQLIDQWNHVCYRLDLYALIGTQAINAVIFAWWMSLTR